MIYKRYVKLYKDFYDRDKNKFNISKIPDIYDNIKYDIIHNKNLINSSGYQLFDIVSLLANFVMPLEYGITKEQKINIGLKIIKPLLKKMYNDLSIILESNQKNEKNMAQLDNNVIDVNNFLLSLVNNTIYINVPNILPVEVILLKVANSLSLKFKSL